MVRLDKRRLVILLILVFSLISLISASTYSLQFDQNGNNVVTSEIFNGKSLGSTIDSASLDRSGNQLYFVKRIKFNQSFSEVQIKFNLDKGVVVKDSLIFPAGYTIETNGEIISINWNLKNVMSGQDFAMFITLEDTKTSFNIFYAILAMLILVLIGFFIYKQSRKKPAVKIIKVKEKVITKKEDYDYLLDTEKNIIEQLKKADRNEMWQKQLLLNTGFSKAKLSRLIKNLETRNLVKKIPFGNTNKVRLK